MENVNETTAKKNHTFSIRPNKLIYKQQCKKSHPSTKYDRRCGTVKMQTEVEKQTIEHQWIHTRLTTFDQCSCVFNLRMAVQKSYSAGKYHICIWSLWKEIISFRTEWERDLCVQFYFLSLAVSRCFPFWKKSNHFKQCYYAILTYKNTHTKQYVNLELCMGAAHSLFIQIIWWRWWWCFFPTDVIKWSDLYFTQHFNSFLFEFNIFSSWIYKEKTSCTEKYRMAESILICWKSIPFTGCIYAILQFTIMQTTFAWVKFVEKFISFRKWRNLWNHQ